MLNLDTHIFIYALAGSLRKKEIELLSNNQWSISSIVIWEIAKLCQLKKIDFNFYDARFSQVLRRIKIWPISYEVCAEISNLDINGDPADEIIAATSNIFHVPLLTRDKAILKSRKTLLYKK